MPLRSPTSSIPSPARVAIVAIAAIAATSAVFTSPPAARGDMLADVDNGNTLDGAIGAGESIRIRFPLAKGASPLLKLTLTNSSSAAPYSIRLSTYYGPDGNAIVVPGKSYAQNPQRGVTTFRFKGPPAAATGIHTLVLDPAHPLNVSAKGSFRVKRPKAIAFSGDETRTTVSVDVVPFDATSLSVTRKSGTAPRIALYTAPAVGSFEPTQRPTKKGSSSANALGVLDYGVVTYTVGYQDPGPLAGEFRGVLRVLPSKTSGSSDFRLINPPGVPLTVRAVDRFLQVTYGSSGCQLSFDGTLVLVTSEALGRVYGQRFDLELDPSPFSPSPVELASSAEFPPGLVISGHRTAFAGGNHFVGVSSLGGASLALVRLSPTLSRLGTGAIVNLSTSHTQDFFLASDGITLSLGRFRAPDGHTIQQIDGETGIFTGPSSEIGGPTQAHARGAGAVWNNDDSVFEFFAPESIVFGQPSDIHRFSFSSNWAPVAPKSTPIADPALYESYSTAVSYDDTANVVIVHYVVPENIATGAGRIYRVLYDDAGAEIPNSRQILAGTDRHRPCSFLLGNYLYLGSDGASGPTVERYRLLR